MRIISDFGAYFFAKSENVMNLSLSSVFGIFIFFLFGNDDPLIILTSSLVVHELMMTYVFFTGPSDEFSKRLASSKIILWIKPRFGRSATTVLCFLLPFIISTFVLLVLSFVVKGSALDYWSDGYQRFIMVVLLLGLLIDPVAYVFLEKSFGDSWTIVFGYLSILMVAIGSVSGRSGDPIFLILQQIQFYFHLSVAYQYT